MPKPKTRNTTDGYLRAPELCKRYGVSDMWLWRRLRDDPSFPKPMRINRIRYFRISELEAWERRQQRRRAA
jgi:predicted DNA-binding transcriptional regulator AlpA